MLPSPESPPSDVVEAEFTYKEEDSLCHFITKKLIRIVTTKWRQVETKTIALPPAGKKVETGGTGLTVVWARDIYNEWEIHTCSLPRGHTETHQGSMKIVYSLVNTVTEEKVYGSKKSRRPITRSKVPSPDQQLRPPTPHFTDTMPEVEITADQIIPPERLPTETVS